MLFSCYLRNQKIRTVVRITNFDRWMSKLPGNAEMGENRNNWHGQDYVGLRLEISVSIIF